MDTNNTKGFALPTTILLVTVLTVMLAAAFTRTSSEHQISDGTRFQDKARSIAEGGLQRYMESTTSRPSDGDSIRINTTGGYAWVFAHALQSPADTMANETFMISSTGYAIEVSQGATPVAQRTVGQMAFWQTGFVVKPAAYTAANGLDTNASDSVTISGNYYAADTSGLRVPTAPTARPKIVITGSPSGVVTGGTAESVALETGIDWARILDGDFSCEETSIFAADFDFTFKSYCITGDFDMDKYYGSGLLVVTGDLTMTEEIVFYNHENIHRFNAFMCPALNGLHTRSKQEANGINGIALCFLVSG